MSLNHDTKGYLRRFVLLTLVTAAMVALIADGSHHRVSPQQDTMMRQVLKVAVAIGCVLLFACAWRAASRRQ